MRNIKGKLSIKIGGLLICLLAIASYCIFSHSGYKEYAGEQSYNSLINVLGNMVKSEGEIKISEEDINTLGTSYFKSEGILRGIKIEGINVDVGKDEITMRIPIEYKKIPLLLSTKGKLTKNEKNIIYTPEYFKVGKIKIPNNTILNYMKKHFSNKVTVNDSSIFLDKNKFRDFEFIKADNNAIIIAAKNETKEVLKKANASIKKIEEQVKKEEGKREEAKKEENSEGKKSTENKQSKQNNTAQDNTVKNNNKNKEFNRQKALAKVKANLNSLSAKVSSAKEKQMVAIMSYTVDRMSSNPNYNFWGNADKVISIYKTLTPKQKKEFKQKFFSSIDMENATKLKSDYGV